MYRAYRVSNSIFLDAARMGHTFCVIRSIECVCCVFARTLRFMKNGNVKHDTTLVAHNEWSEFLLQGSISRLTRFGKMVSLYVWWEQDMSTSSLKSEESTSGPPVFMNSGEQ
jgi:hypothetical protein